MASTGAQYPTSTGEIAFGSAQWEADHFITADDGQCAYTVLDASDFTYYLYGNGFDSAFSSIPDEATIVGVRCIVRAYATDADSVADCAAKLLSTGGTPTGSDRSAYTYLAASSPSPITYGGTTDLWGCALTPSWVKDTNFGVAVAYTSEQDAQDVNVDCLTVEVFYTEAGGAKCVTARAFAAPRIVCG